MLNKKVYKFLQEELPNYNNALISRKLEIKFWMKKYNAKNFVIRLRKWAEAREHNEDKVKFILTLLDYENSNRDNWL